MIEIRRILCPIDFSDFSRHALGHAVTIARWYESTVTLLHVVPIVPLAAYAPGSGVVPSANLGVEDREGLLASMRQFAAEAGTTADVPLEFRLAEGHTAAEIVHAAESLSSDLIVMGTHGRSGFERLMLGSVTERVLRKAPDPVLSVTKGPDDADVGAPSFKRILCAVDFSDCSVRALDYAMSLAQEADASLTAVHVIEVPTSPSPEMSQTILEGYVHAATQECRLRLEPLIPETVRNHCSVQTMVAKGTPHREILRIAAEQASDLIVIGVHGRDPVDLLFFGSTAQQVVRVASCPVLTLRS